MSNWQKAILCAELPCRHEVVHKLPTQTAARVLVKAHQHLSCSFHVWLHVRKACSGGAFPGNTIRAQHIASLTLTCSLALHTSQFLSRHAAYTRHKRLRAPHCSASVGQVTSKRLAKCVCVCVHFGPGALCAEQALQVSHHPSSLVVANFEPTHQTPCHDRQSFSARLTDSQLPYQRQPCIVTQRFRQHKV